MVTLVGFGTFYAARAARTGRNRAPRGARHQGGAVPKFRAGKALKDAIN